MKNLVILSVLMLFVTSTFAQLVTKTATSSKTTGVNITFSTDKANKPFSIHTVLENTKMGTNDTILMTMFVSNDNKNWVAYPSFSTLTFKKTTYSQITSGTLMYKYLKVTYTGSSNDSTFTITSYLFKE